MNVRVHTAPVSAMPSIRRNQTPRTRVLQNGHLSVSNSTIIPVSMANNTTGITLSTDTVVGNNSAFPTLGNLSKNFDKIKWHSLRAEYIPAVPTTTGGNVALYFDSDRTDVGPTTVSQALQNKGCIITPVWQKMKYTVPKQMLRPSEWFTTDTDPVAAAPSPQANNTFPSPGRLQLYVTPLLGVTFTTATTVGWVKLDYSVEFGFPSGESAASIPPSRRIRDQGHPVHHVLYDRRHVAFWKNFQAGCVSPPDFYTFLGCLDASGRVQRHLVARYEPDLQSFEALTPLDTQDLCEPLCFPEDLMPHGEDVPEGFAYGSAFEVAEASSNSDVCY